MTTSPNFPTDKQIAFVRTLLEERAGMDAAEAVRGELNVWRLDGTLDKIKISKTIEKLLAIPKPAPKVVTLDEGMYADADGEIYRVVTSKTSGRKYAKRLMRENAGEGRKLEFEFDRAYIKKLTPAMRMSLEAAKAAGVLMGACCVCGATLTNEVSVREGIGPVCGGRV